MRYLLTMLAAALPVCAVQGQVYSGPALAVDGDTLSMTGERIRLFGIDAPEGAQTCDRGGKRWTCGQDAKALLSGLVAGKTVSCAQKDRDDYGRIVATCEVGGTDLSGFMAREGYAVALSRFSDDYIAAETRAKAFRLALWDSVFQLPADYRAANPAQFAPPPAARVAARAQRASTRPAYAAVAFRNCRDARAAGAAPLYRGQPGYGAHMDGDGDGVACEPYRGR